MLHLYHKTKVSKDVQDTIDAFEFCDSVDISEIDNIQDDDIYIVEIDKAQKELLLHIRRVLLNKKDSLIYFFINDSNSLMLFQLASLLNVKSIITQKNDIPKSILNIKKDFLHLEELKRNKNLLGILENEEYFLVYKDKKLQLASQKIYKDFEFLNIREIESKIDSIFDLEDNSTSIYNDKKYKTTHKKIDSSGEIFIYIQSITQNTFNTDFIISRIYFIESLKEKVFQDNTLKPNLGIITIEIENISNLKKDWNEYEIEVAVRDLLLQVKITIPSEIILAQYDNGLYLTLFEDLDFVALKEKALLIKKSIIEYTKNKKIKPMIGLYAFDINNLELNKILEMISDIAVENVKPEDIQTQKLHKILNLDVDLDDERAIDIFLQTVFINKIPVRLVNIYKGICINTSSFIIKKTDKDVYVTYEQLQGTVMQFEGSTVIQSSSFSKDILADVKYIDLKKKVVQLKNFRFIDGSANARKYSRVTCSVRTPISISLNRETLNGDILDISMNSIAIKTRVYNKLDNIKNKSVTLNFSLPIQNNEDGYARLKLDAKVIVAFCTDEYCKIVVNLEENQASESILMEYVYNRQKEIISELKKQTMLFQ